MRPRPLASARVAGIWQGVDGARAKRWVPAVPAPTVPWGAYQTLPAPGV